MKAGWTHKRLEELVEIRLGRTPPRAEKKFWDPTKTTDNTWVSIADLSENEGGVITESKEHLSKAGADSTPLVKAGTLLVSFKLSLGKVAIAGKDLRTNEAIAAMPIKGSGLDVNWLKYFFQFFDWDKAAIGEEKVKGKALNKEKLKEIEIPLPPLAEQKRIVALLDEAFAGIDEAKAKVAHLNKSTSSILPAKLNQVFSQPLATGPKLSINDFSQVYDGPHATPKTTDKGPIFLGISSLKDGAIELSETRHVSLQDFKRWTRRVQPQAGDVVFSYETRIGQVAVIPDNLECCLGRRMGLVRLDNQRMMPGFFAFQYLSPPFQKFLQSKTVKGVTVDRISLKEFPSFEIWVPGLSLQKKINQEVQESQTLALHLSRLLAKKLDHLNELKTSLLRQAFTGALFT